MDLHEDLLEAPQHRFFMVEKPLLKPKKQDGIYRFVQKSLGKISTSSSDPPEDQSGKDARKIDSVPASPVSSKSSSRAVSPVISGSDKRADTPAEAEDTEKEDPTSEEAIKKKIEELKEEKHRYFNMFKEMINKKASKSKKDKLDKEEDQTVPIVKPIARRTTTPALMVSTGSTDTREPLPSTKRARYSASAEQSEKKFFPENRYRAAEYHHRGISTDFGQQNPPRPPSVPSDPRRLEPNAPTQRPSYDREFYSRFDGVNAVSHGPPRPPTALGYGGGRYHHARPPMPDPAGPVPPFYKPRYDGPPPSKPSHRYYPPHHYGSRVSGYSEPPQPYRERDIYDGRMRPEYREHGPPVRYTAHPGPRDRYAGPPPRYPPHPPNSRPPHRGPAGDPNRSDRRHPPPRPPRHG